MKIEIENLIGKMKKLAINVEMTALNSTDEEVDVMFKIWRGVINPEQLKRTLTAEAKNAGFNADIHYYNGSIRGFVTFTKAEAI